MVYYMLCTDWYTHGDMLTPRKHLYCCLQLNWHGFLHANIFGWACMKVWHLAIPNSIFTKQLNQSKRSSWTKWLNKSHQWTRHLILPWAQTQSWSMLPDHSTSMWTWNKTTFRLINFMTPSAASKLVWGGMGTPLFFYWVMCCWIGYAFQDSGLKQGIQFGYFLYTLDSFRRVLLSKVACACGGQNITLAANQNLIATLIVGCQRK